MRAAATFHQLSTRVLLDTIASGNQRLPVVDEPVISAPAATSGFASGPGSSSKPALGFPLGTAIILFIVFGISTVFSCCYHWEKIRTHANRFSSQGTRGSSEDSPSSETSSQPEEHHLEQLHHNDHSKQQFRSSQELSLPVVMPGDDIPKFVAWPSSLKV